MTAAFSKLEAPAGQISGCLLEISQSRRRSSSLGIVPSLVVASVHWTLLVAMPVPVDDSSDIDKLFKAFGDVGKSFGSIDDFLQAFGLAGMPTAQRYGILFGCIVFTLTITAVFCLLLFGGTFQRMAQQSRSGDATVKEGHVVRAERALLLERLLDGRLRMLQKYKQQHTSSELTPLTKMLLNEAPLTSVADLVVVDEEVSPEERREKIQQVRRVLPPHYEQNYITAYRKCQDQPGGTYVCVCVCRE